MKKPRFTFAVFFLIAAARLAPSCNLKKQNERAILEEVSSRVAIFRANKLETCRETLFAAAEKQVDSILIAQALLHPGDTLARPTIPNKPARPSAKPPTDTQAIRPLF
jgi:hypothetical protein